MLKEESIFNLYSRYFIYFFVFACRLSLMSFVFFAIVLSGKETVVFTSPATKRP